MAVVKSWFLVAISLLAGSAWADARSDLSGLLGQHNHLTARFEQEIRGERDELLERSTGTVALQRPLFRWEIELPYPQTLVADGNQLQIYDPDLEQLTVREMDAALDHTPLAVLTRHDVVLAESYDVEQLQTDNEIQRFALRPRADDALFAEVHLDFSEGVLSQLLIRDHLGQETRIRFEEVRLDAVLQSGDFELDVPPDTDVIDG